MHLRDRAQFIRLETIRLIEIAKVGHYSSVFSAAETFAALYYDVMRLSDDPKWPDRDRFLMGKGHAAVGLFPIFADLEKALDKHVADFCKDLEFDLQGRKVNNPEKGIYIRKQGADTQKVVLR